GDTTMRTIGPWWNRSTCGAPADDVDITWISPSLMPTSTRFPARSNAIADGCAARTSAPWFCSSRTCHACFGAPASANRVRKYSMRHSPDSPVTQSILLRSSAACIASSRGSPLPWGGNSAPRETSARKLPAGDSAMLQYACANLGLSMRARSTLIEPARLPVAASNTTADRVLTPTTHPPPISQPGSADSGPAQVMATVFGPPFAVHTRSFAAHGVELRASGGASCRGLGSAATEPPAAIQLAHAGAVLLITRPVRSAGFQLRSAS